MPYRYLEHLTLADMAFEATAQSPEDLFKDAVDALQNVMLSDLSTIQFREVRHDVLKAQTEEELLHALLQKAVFYKDADQLLLRVTRISMQQNENGLELEVELQGEKINPKKHELLVDVKAVTHHQFCVSHDIDEKTGNARWMATVVLDV